MDYLRALKPKKRRSPKKKKPEPTLVQEIPKDTKAKPLKTTDGGYLGPAAFTPDPSNDPNNNQRKSTKGDKPPPPASTNLNRPSSADSAPPPGKRARKTSTLEGGSPRLGRELDVESLASSQGSGVEQARCCNPDYGICGGYFYPFSCVGFGETTRLLVVAVGLFALLLGLIIGIVVILSIVLFPPGKTRLCLTPECIIAAGEIISSMDQTVDPCLDFDEFVCGGWKKNNPVPAGLPVWDTFSKLADTTNFMLKELLEKPTSATDSKSVNAAKVFYKACTNTSAWQERGVVPLVAELNRVGGFPMINSSWVEAGFQWVQAIVMHRKFYAADLFFSVHAALDEADTSRYAIHISEGYIPSPREYIVSNDSKTRYLEFNRMYTIVEMLSAKKSYYRSEESSNTSTAHNADDLKQEFATTKHKRKMQSRRNEVAVTLDGIAPDLNKMRIRDIMKEEQEMEKEEHAENILINSRQTLSLDPLQEDVENLWNFIYSITYITTSPEQAADDWGRYNPMTVRELQDYTDKLDSGSSAKMDWLVYLNDVFSDVNVTLDYDERVIVYQTEYIPNLLRLISTTSKRVLANYLGYMLVLNLGEEAALGFGPGYTGLRPRGHRLTSPGRSESRRSGSGHPGPERSGLDPGARFNGLNHTPLRHSPAHALPGYIGRKELRPWYDCSTKTNMMLGRAVAQLYVEHTMPANALDKVEEMVSDVHTSFEEIIFDASWMDERTRNLGLKKLNAMISLVGYPENTTSKEALDHYYSQLPELSATNHFGNVMLLARYFSRSTLSILNTTPSRTTWGLNPVTINAAYSSYQNAMVIPAGILQPPFYRRNTFTALNYGALGVVVGHEITHGFDDSGKKLDAHGNLKQWWSSSANRSYHERARCFIDQFDAFPPASDLVGDKWYLRDYRVSGSRTQGENIADNGGLDAAWRAFKQRVRENGEEAYEPRLPGLHYNHRQLFFISFAQLWCGGQTPEGLRMSLLLGVHAPGRYRVLGCFKNSASMKDTFNCPARESDNNTESCRLW